MNKAYTGDLIPGDARVVGVGSEAIGKGYRRFFVLWEEMPEVLVEGLTAQCRGIPLADWLEMARGVAALRGERKVREDFAT